MEYNKILEEKGESLSSLCMLNEEIYNTAKDTFKVAYVNNKEKLTRIKTADFHSNMKKLRDKKFAHSDRHKINLPFQIKGFTPIEIKEGLHQLYAIKEILDSCTFFFNCERILKIPSTYNRTENFIRDHAKYQEYCFDNYIEYKNETFNSKDNSLIE